MVDLKENLQLLNFNECMSCIRNLEGIIDFDNVIYISGLLTQTLP